MKALLRIFTLLRVLVRHRLDVPLLRQTIPFALRLAIWLMPWRHLVPVRGSEPQRVKDALIDLGPVFVKFGQLLATRRDLLADEWVEPLASLLDKVPPFSGQAAQVIIEEAIGQPVAEAFKEFELTPLASASVAQVHAARLSSGEAVVVKVIRPGIKRVMYRDIRLMRALARLLNTWVPDFRRLRANDVINEFEKTLYDELDLQREAANASQLERNFTGSELLYIPQTYWQYTNRKVLVQERIFGLPVNDIAAIEAAGIDRKELARVGVEIFFTQVFRDSFFHADMHPGNIFVNPATPSQPQYMAVDFGIVGSLTHEDQAYLARILLAFFERDYHQIAQLHVDCGWLPADTPVREFESAIRAVSEPIFARPLAEISFAQVLLGLFQTARRFNMQVQPQLVLLQKTMLNIEGLGRQLYPQLDLWQTAQPILRQWYKAQVSPKQVVRQLRDSWPDMAQQLPQLPGLLHKALEQQAQPRELGDIKSEKPRQNSLLPFALLAAGLFTMPLNWLWLWQHAPLNSLLIIVALFWLWRGNR
ncbi:MAG: ubiquinone biosynthesis regulatory protein kinase UbiB [Gammaproteobacteria bacterium]|jgi:ubiquinone biosynthesis protein|nr:ubiquinone biosynthesis regulatory protein kinase UbiB [Gammaproteobacteria bacterium]